MTVKELKKKLNNYDENDFVVLETVDEHGDTIDIYPFIVYAVAGVQTRYGTCTEVRIVQRHIEKN